MEDISLTSSQESLSLKFYRILQNLPVDASSFVSLSRSNPNKLFDNNVIEQLLVVLLNEPDIRISNKATKLQILEIFMNVTKSSRRNRVRMRLLFQLNHEWFTDDVEYDHKYAGEILPERDPLLIKLIKTVFSACWKTESKFASSIINNEELSIESSKTRFIEEYGAIAMQSIIRSHQARVKLYQSLKKQAEEQEVEIREWSILILQKIARGYIARKTVLRSMQIRKSLSKEVLRITERYLKKGDLWGFLKEINDELDRSNKVIVENQAREDNWASNFVEKVIKERQAQFDDTWEKFPKALSEFTGKHSTAASLIDQSTTSKSSSSNKGKVNNNLNKETIKTKEGNSMKSNRIIKNSPTKNLITPNEVALAVDHNNTALSRISDSSNADHHLSVPGPLMRKALSNSLNIAVADQLNKLVNNEYRSKQLVKNFRDVYEPHSDPANKSKLKPIDNDQKVVKLSSKKKKRVGIDGKPIVDVGKINAAQSDWLKDSYMNSSSINHESSSQSVGESLLLDVPNGLEDSIERLMHAAAIRCYVPDFFKGVSPLEINESGDDMLLEDDLDEEVYAARAKLRKQRIKDNPNTDPSYAYQMYLKLPMGLAKMRYELQCQKWSQGSINKLRVKGLNYLSDVFPLSKFIMCMKSVDTPTLLMNTCVDLYLELRNIGRKALVGQIDKKTISKLARSVQKNISSSELSIENENKIVMRVGSPVNNKVLNEANFVDNQSVNPSDKDESTLYIENELANLKTRNNEIPSKVLLTMIEDQQKSVWCDLKSPIENIFLHAAFLIVPYAKTIEDNSGKIKSKHKCTTRIESAMGNFAFKLYTDELMKLKSDEEKREAIKERFRACFILTTPFTLFLKNKQVFTVEDLLKVNLSDLGLPKALEIQLEVLLVVVVSKCVDAKIIPVPRDHLSTAEDLFTVPMFYDPKFQRSPFDAYGRPPRLQPIGGKKLIQRKLKSEAKTKSQALQAHLNLNKVASLHSIEEDLDIPVKIWTSSDHQPVLDSNSKMNNTMIITDDSNVMEKDSKWSFYEDEDDYTSEYFQTLKNNSKTMKKPMSSLQQQQQSQLNHLSNNDSDSKHTSNVLHTSGGSSSSSSMKQRMNAVSLIKEKQEDYLTQSITKKVFKNTYTCTYPHCHQVFSRLYTFKIHLKSHEIFGQYHEFKRKPQLYLDRDHHQIMEAKSVEFEQSVNLSHTVTSELNSLSLK